MIAEYRFMRTRDGVTRFARVTVLSTESPAWSTALGESVRELGVVYGEAIQDGLALAMAEQDRRNGRKYTVVVTDLIESAVDTSPDAVECAVAVAAWKSFGEEERSASFDFDDGRWKVAFE